MTKADVPESRPPRPGDDTPAPARPGEAATRGAQMSAAGAAPARPGDAAGPAPRQQGSLFTDWAAI